MDKHFLEGDDVPYSADIDDFVDIGEVTCWECVMCGKCCGNVFSRTWLDVSLTSFVGDPVDGYCQHYNRSSGICSIHENRPNICRGYPFILRKDGDSFKIQVHRKCSGLGKGEIIDQYSKGEELVKLIEDDLDMDFIIRPDGKGGVRLYRVK